MDLMFRYTPLDQPNEQIRLLTIHPGEPDSPIECTLALVFLKPQPPPYVAISYTWGPPTPTVTISINGKAMPVRQSCHDALHTMRLHRFEVPLWIDAICINQTDMREKNFQVAMMGAIYHGAISVAACLQCGDSLSMMRNLHPLIPKTLNFDHEQDNVFERWQAAVSALLENVYFTRMWIVQEIGLAQDVRLYSGEDVLDWTELERQSYDWRAKMMALKRYPTGTDRERALKELSDTRTEMGTHQVYGHQKQDQTLTLTGLMSSHLKRGCENPRDRLYAMLPMLKHAGGFDYHHMQPDYSKSEWVVLYEYVSTIRFPVEPERRRNSISTGFELWTGLETFKSLVECFKIPPSDIIAFLEARRSRAEQHPFSNTYTSRPPSPIGTHFVGYAMRISCPNSNEYTALVRDNDTLSTLQSTRHFLAVWPGLPTAAFTVGPRPISNNPEAFSIEGYYPLNGEVHALQRLPEKCGCRYPSCPARRSKRDIYMHPEDLLAMVFLTQNSPNRVIDCFTTAHTQSFIRMWEPEQMAPKAPPPGTLGSVASMLASLGRSIGRRL